MNRADHIARFASLVILSANEAGLSDEEAITVFTACVDTLRLLSAESNASDDDIVQILRNTVKQQLRDNQFTH